MNKCPNHAQQTLSRIYSPTLALLDLVYRLEDADYTVCAFVELDKSGRHASLQRYAGVADRLRRIRGDVPTLPHDALILTSHSMIGELYVLDPRTGSLSPYLRPAEVVTADPRAKAAPAELNPADVGLHPP